jgi:transketolase
VKSVCKDIRKQILRVAKESGHGHIPSCFSIVEILWAVYSVLHHNPDNPSWKDRDLFILSKGHGALAYYCVLTKLGFFPPDGINTLGGFQSSFGCHPDRFKVPGIEASTGSLGHGIGLAVGMSLALKIEQSDRRVVTLIGDGEANEGSVWEALLVASNLVLPNMTVIYDDNRSHSRGLQIDNPVEKFLAFGCEATEVDGHDVEALMAVLKHRATRTQAIIAHTYKGYGCRSFIDNPYEWHRRSPNEGEYRKLLEELDA